jgi:hypothetical protein
MQSLDDRGGSGEPSTFFSKVARVPDSAPRATIRMGRLGPPGNWSQFVMRPAQMARTSETVRSRTGTSLLTTISKMITATGVPRSGAYVGSGGAAPSDIAMAAGAPSGPDVRREVRPSSDPTLRMVTRVPPHWAL